MSQALMYRPRGRSLAWAAFGCAIAIHLTAIVVAENKLKPLVVGAGPDSFDPPVVGLDDSPAPPQEQEVTPSEHALAITESDFSEENPTPPPIRLRKKSLVAPVAQSIGIGTTAATHGGSARALTLYAPRPAYPYEARRSGITGSGVAHLTVDPAAGNVLDAEMGQSTGNAILDNATLNALRRWRFKPGVASRVEVPITYTLTGVSY